MPTARRHHYIPQWYLAGFTDTGTADGFITVHDLVEDRDFRTKPHGVGVRRDFNRIEVEGIDPDALEQAWSQFEGDASQAVRRIIEAGNIENGEDLTYLLNLVALLAVRNPRFREQMNQSQDQLLRLMGQMAVSNKERYERLIEQMRSEGIEIPDDVTYEQVKDFADRGEFDIQIPREQNIQLEVEVIGTVIDILHKRNWSLYTPEKPDSHFVSCDHPVVLSWRDQKMSGPIGFGLTNTEVTFPVSKRIMLIGIFENDLDALYEVPDMTVAFANSQRQRNAQRHVYSSNDSYVFATRRKS